MTQARSPGPLTVGPFLEAWELELRANVWRDELPDLIDRLNEDYLYEGAPEEECAAVIAAAQAAHPALLARLMAEEQAWVGPTDCDRLDAAFAALGAHGVHAQVCGLTLQDAHAAAALVCPPTARGLCLVHQGDVLDALWGEGLLLAVDVAGDAAGTPAARAALAALVVEQLRAHGLPATWTGDPDDRVWIRPFAWRRRRWTAPPMGELRGPLSSGPGPRAMRLAPRVEVTEAALAPYLQPVIARYSTSAFDPDFARIMRGVWRSLGGTWGQVAHAGLPHTFVPAGEETTLTVRDALANLAPEAAAALRAEARRRGGTSAQDTIPDERGPEGEAALTDAVGAEPAPDPAAVAATTAALRRFVVGVSLAALGPPLAVALASVLPAAQAGLAGGALSGLLLAAPVAGHGPRGRLIIGAAVALGALLGAVVGAERLG
ncbi:MAG: hypothetical protein JNM72_20525 [Deltaproteobacteria bacterium]|nr:hypothetical protein [Deltaproteobacteria bacterium]